MSMLASLLGVLLALIFLSASPTEAADWQGRIVTANERDNTLTFISWPEKSQDKLAVPISPHNAQFTRNGKLLLAVGAARGGKGHEQHTTGGLLLIIETASATPGTIETVAIAGHPAHVVSDRYARFAYVTDAANNSVLVVDLAAKAVVGSIPVGTYPHGLRMSPDEREIYIANMVLTASPSSMLQSDMR